VTCRVRRLVSALAPPVAILVLLTGCQDSGAPPPSIRDVTALATPSLATPSPQRAPVPSPAPAADQTLLDASSPGPPPGWPDDPLGQAQFTPAGYLIQPRDPGQFVAIRAPLADSVRDLTLSGRFRKTGGPPGGGYGLIVRDQTPQLLDGRRQNGRFYVLEASDRGEIGIWRRDGDQWIELLGWSTARAVRSGLEENELSARASGAELAFSVNGVALVRVNDAALDSGGVGVFVGGDGNQVLLERLTLQELSR
jgi:hypothetical protein